MTTAAPRPASEVAWAAYAEALGSLHAAREAAVAAHRAARRAEAARAAEISALTARVAQQQQALVAFADRLGAPLTPADLSPAAVPPGDPAQAPAELRRRLDAADAELAEARRVAALPQLLPAWESAFARAAVVYAAFAVPNVLLTVALAMAGVHESRFLKVWFIVLWPALTAIVGGLVVAHVSRPRAAEEPAAGEPARGTAVAPRSTPGRWGRHYRRFGLLLAWASWLVPGYLLAPVSLWTG
jgi:hypothetical protein